MTLPYVKGSATSADAADAARPRAARDRDRVLAAIRAAGAGGLTDQQLQDLLDLDGSTERPRRIDLVECGLVQDTTRPGTARQANTWGDQTRRRSSDATRGGLTMAAAAKKAAPTDVHVSIEAPKIVTAIFKCRGTAPYMQNRFSAKAMQQMRDAQCAGSTGKKGKKREPKDFDACYDGAKHVSTEGWLGIPAPAFRNALVSACRLTGFAMTRAKLSVFVMHDGLDVVDSTPLVRITKGEPTRREMPVRNESGVVDIRVRPVWESWEFTLRVQFDADQFTDVDVANLLMRAGLQVGVGEGRPDSKKSTGLGFGTFMVLDR